MVLTESVCEQSSENSLKIVGNYWQQFFSTQLLHYWYGGKMVVRVALSLYLRDTQFKSKSRGQLNHPDSLRTLL